MSEDHPVRRGAIASYLGGVFVLITVWVAGWWLRIWPAVVAFLGRPHSLTLPAWLWFLLLLLALALASRGFLASSRSSRTAIPAATRPAVQRPQIDELEMSIMQLFEQRDMSPISYTQLLAANKLTNLRLSKAVDRLREFGMVDMSVDLIRLTTFGRDFLLELSNEGGAGQIT